MPSNYPAISSDAISTKLTYKSFRTATLLHIFLSLIFSLASVAQSSEPKPAPTPQSNQIIVKLKPSFAQTVETEFSTAIPVQQMHVSEGQAKNPQVQAFMQRHSARRLSPLYPQIIRKRQEHGWSDSQYAEHIRQHYAKRAQRHRQSSSVPEISRSYAVDLGSVSAEQKAQALQLLKADPDVEFAEPEHTLSKVDLPNDPFLSSSGSWGQPYQDLWGLYAIGAPTAWNTAQGKGVVVAVVDTGLDYNNPDLAANVWSNVNEIPNLVDDDGNGFIDDVLGWNFVYNNNDPRDDNGHGTHVAGTIAAVGNNGIGVIGVAWQAQVMAVKALDFNGNGFDSSVAPAIMYAASNGADIINASWGMEGTDQTIEEAIQFADALGVVFVAAAGNSNEDAMNFFPANSPEAITVAASDPFGNFAFFSNFGPKVDATAPGVGILSLQAANTFVPGIFVSPGYLVLDGTSMAAAHVSGVAALALSQNSAYSTDQVRQIIRSSDTPNPNDTRFGYGSLNAAAAVAIVNPLQAKITGVQFGTLGTDPITITGFAQGTGFSNYILEYGQGTQPFFWTQFFSSTTPASGTLGQLDPSNLFFSGVYSIRLTAFNTNGNAFVDRTQFTVTFAQITSPPAGVGSSTYKPGFLVPIVGTASMPFFQGYTVQWSSQDGSTGWQTTGITLTGNGQSPLVNTQLATWDTSGITTAGYYNILLTVFGAQQASTTVYLEPDLLSFAWPVFLDLGPCLECPVVPALNPDGSYRLLVGTTSAGSGPNAALWTIHPDGSSQKTVLNSGGAVHQPSAGSIDNLPGDEAVAVDFNVVDIFHPDGTLDVFTPNAGVFLTNSTLVLADLNNDFQLESVAVGTTLGGNAAYLFAWQPNGQQVNGFPVQLQENNNLYGISNLTRIIAGDFDGDGSKEILVIEGLSSTTYGLSLFNHDGTRKPFNAPVLTGVPAGMAAADLDHNGKLETILINQSDALGTQATIHVFQPDGSERPGWPVDVSASHSSFFSFSGVAVGDLNRDGHEEIVLSNGSGLYVFNSDGTLFPGTWPVAIVNTTTYLRPLIADIDGDGLQEIIVPFDDFNSYRLQLRAFGRDGSVLKTWTLAPAANFFSNFDGAATIGDFNQDGSTDIAVAYSLEPVVNAPVGGLVTMLETHSAFVAANNDWPMVLQNPRNNPVLLRTSPSSLAVTLSSGANPSVIGDTLVFTATVTPTGNGSVQFLDGGSPLSGSIQLNNGTASFTTSTLALGSHSITARYTGDNQRSASVSPALVQNVVKGNSSVSVSLTAGTNPALIGDSLTFTAMVAPSSATGSVVFFDGATAISGNVPVAAGSASVTISTLSFGTHSITAQYSGDATFNGATSTALPQTINNPKANSTISLVLSAGTNPSVFGAPLTFTASVAPSSATGTVTFFDGTVAIGSLPLTNGTASFSTSTMGAGTHSITAQYSGDANFNGATSGALVQTVAKAKTEVELELSLNDAAFVAGTPLTFMATVTPTTATGTVTFFDGTTAISAPIPLSNGSVSFTTASLSVGSHSISALYSGDANYYASSSSVHPLNIK